MSTPGEQEFPLSGFNNVSEWVFDLDNTLYPRHSDLFGQIDKRMTNFVARLTGLDSVEARKLQKQLYRDHGTTLRGLMHQFDIEPRTFLDDVHDIDYSELDPNPELGELIKALPGRKHIFTNGDLRHAQNTLKAIGIDGIFDEMFDIVAADYVPKPDKSPYDKFLDSHNVDPCTAAMFEDMPRNLTIPKEMGMVTVLITSERKSNYMAENWEHHGSGHGHIDHRSDDINRFLSDVIAELAN